MAEVLGFAGHSLARRAPLAESMRLASTAFSSILSSSSARAILSRPPAPASVAASARSRLALATLPVFGTPALRRGVVAMSAASAAFAPARASARLSAHRRASPIPAAALPPALRRVARGVAGSASRARTRAVADPSSDADAPPDAAASLLSPELTWPSRSHLCGLLREANEGETVTLCGWVDKQRDMGGIVFADVRDHTGLVQVVSDDDTPADAVDALAAIRPEWVVCVTGRVARRVSPNDKMPTGQIEIRADAVVVLNTVGKSLPFAVSGAPEGEDEELREEVRLKHRVLDLRRPQMVRNLRLRAKTIRALRAVLEDEHDFLEVETPVLTRSTPEGARDYLVPSRLQPGACYAVPQSPQLFKQMLMVAGADRYYQVARCFRDEDLRADRQPEFTQLDIEMAFTDEEGILNLGEDLMCAAFREGAGVELPRPFRRMTYAEAMRKYGSDKPDVRYGLEMAVLDDAVRDSGFKLF